MALTPSTMLKLGTPAPDFSLTQVGENVTVERTDFTGRPLLVMFICNHCPFVKHINQHLATTCKELQGKGLAVVGISSNDAVNYPDDSPEKMIEESKTAGYTFPYLYDETQDAAKAYRAACTPDFFLFDKTHKLVYRGQYDDSRPDNGKPVTGADVIAAAKAVLAGQAVSSEQKPSIGCNIKWKAGAAPDYFQT